MTIMRNLLFRVALCALVVFGIAPIGPLPLSAAVPRDGEGFIGRIALSHDGNFNDEDDWGALPAAVAILDAFGVANRLVHVEYNNIVQANDARFEREMTASVLGAAERYGLSKAILHDCRKDLAGAIESIRGAVNASSRENPLYYLLAGPMDVPYRGLLAADPAGRRHVYCISHSSWNDGFGKRSIDGRTKRDLISLGVKWIQVAHGGLLAHSGRPGTRSTPAEWALFHWMRDSADPRLRWLFTRLEAEERCDVSDATMAYFLLTGDEKCDPGKLAALLAGGKLPAPVAIRPTIRLEAENFPVLETCLPVAAGKGASQDVIVRVAEGRKGILGTEFNEMYVPASGRYDVGIRCRGRGAGGAAFAFRVDGVPRSAAWTDAAAEEGWETHTVRDVLLSLGDTIEIEVRADGAGRGEVDFVELAYLGPNDPAAMPRQIIIDPGDPRRLRCSGCGRRFLFGAGNPEEFFFLGKREPDGTRSGGRQTEMIRKRAGTGAHTLHSLAMRDSRYNIEPGKGAPGCNPFVDGVIAGRLDEEVLGQWERRLAELEQAGLNGLGSGERE